AGLVAVLAAVGATIGTPVGIPWASLVFFLGLLTAAEYLIVRVHLRNQVLAITLFEAALAPLLFSSPTVAVVAVVLVAETITGFLRRNHPVKHAFNVAQFTSAAAVGSIVFQLLRHGPSATPRNLFVLAVAMTSVATVNIVTLSTVMCLADGAPFVGVLRKLAPA